MTLELSNEQRLQEFEVHARKNLNCQQHNFKGNSSKASERKEASYRKSFFLENIYEWERFDEVSDGNGECYW